ncbi:MAG: leucyl aminopeptidase [Gemmatimonadetes bacterium]|nr:leucyl aminopeptidase [Gemmatimonadota bacterium]
MDLDLSTESLLEFGTPLLIVPLPEGFSLEPDTVLGRLDDLLGGGLARAHAAGDFQGRTDDRMLMYASGNGPERVLFLGLGKSPDVDAHAIRNAAGRGVREAEGLKITRIALALSHLEAESPLSWGQGGAEGLILASWRFQELKAPVEDEAPLVESATLLVSQGEDWREGMRLGAAFGRGENLARTLQARPGNVATPTHLAEEAGRIAQEAGLDLTVLGPEEMESEGMKALLSVSHGSDQEPRLIILKHGGGKEGSPPLVLVGKGLTFDAGGISLKPPKGMEDMKYDMSGGAAVLGAMWAIGTAGLKANVVGIVPSSENLINGSATKPGDVIGSRAGKTIEVINTDAEGRLILADALSYATDLAPAAIVDCATLTGACVVALGHHRSAVMGSDDELVAELEVAGERAGEPCWRLPLGKEYRKQLDSDFADLKNVGGPPGGSITAACFLQEFVGDAPWAHLDIAGTAYGETTKPYLRKGPLGVPTRHLVEWVRARAAGGSD